MKRYLRKMVEQLWRTAVRERWTYKQYLEGYYVLLREG